MNSYFTLQSGNREFSEITPEIYRLSKKCIKNNIIDPSLYNKYDVKRGLRDLNGPVFHRTEGFSTEAMTLKI